MITHTPVCTCILRQIITEPVMPSICFRDGLRAQIFSLVELQILSCPVLLRALILIRISNRWEAGGAHCKLIGLLDELESMPSHFWHYPAMPCCFACQFHSRQARNGSDFIKWQRTPTALLFWWWRAKNVPDQSDTGCQSRQVVWEKRWGPWNLWEKSNLRPKAMKVLFIYLFA